MLENFRNFEIATRNSSIDVEIDLTNSNTGAREHAVVVNNHYAIVGMVERFARRQHISPWAVEVHVSQS
ncbi:MAG: hypothetical protein OER96_00010 [Gammaproteobacteria bacterium]|nr:hypothetical protein [Gammaproteobacteria bacterium]